ncbi:MAG: flagellar filament capping protein FliD [Candidatus Gastranaerophilales bacterium]|nr:flagellar filament capping protein FliD [Candidatus Gastranaerophilales bacterium]MCM1073113.1 flagellar filament capping protein FliD [Bacteroides sp.]
MEKVTDTKFGVGSMDLFAQNLAISSKANILTATANSEAQEGIYTINVNNLASNTQASSGFSQVTTQTISATATLGSTLTSLGVKAGKIGVTVNGIERNVKIGNDETIQSFIEKLNNIGAKASYNENSGVFSINLSTNDIRDIDNTGIIKALHLQGVNSGYTSNTLQTNKIETVYEQATLNTKLSELGIKSGNIRVFPETNGSSSDATTINISSNQTLGDLIKSFQDAGYEASLTDDGRFTLNCGMIEDRGTGILDVLGWDDAKASSTTQTSKPLQYTSTLVEGSVANRNTLLKDIDGVTVNNGDTIIVKNSNNQTSTITLSNTSTIGNVLDGLNSAGMSASINSKGIVTISDGSIVGGTFDIAAALGLDVESSTSSVTSNAIYVRKTIAQDVTSTATVTYTSVRDAVESDLVGDFVDLYGGDDWIYIEGPNNGNNGDTCVDDDWTFQDLFDYLGNYGISATMNNGVISLENNGDFYLRSDIGIGMLLGIGTISTSSSSTVTSAVTKTSETLYYTHNVVATQSDQINSYVTCNTQRTITYVDTTAMQVKYKTVDAAVGTIVDSEGNEHEFLATNTLLLATQYINDIRYVGTFNDLFSRLADYGITATMSNGVITLNSSNGAYVKGELFEQLGIQTVESTTNTTVGANILGSGRVTYTITTVTSGTSVQAGITGAAVTGSMLTYRVDDVTIGMADKNTTLKTLLQDSTGITLFGYDLSVTLNSLQTGVRDKTITLSYDDTVSDIVNKLQAEGVGISININSSGIKTTSLTLDPSTGTHFISGFGSTEVKSALGFGMSELTTSKNYTVTSITTYSQKAITSSQLSIVTTTTSTTKPSVTGTSTLGSLFNFGSKTSGTMKIEIGKLDLKDSIDTPLNPGTGSSSGNTGTMTIQSIYSETRTIMVNFDSSMTVNEFIWQINNASNDYVSAKINGTNGILLVATMTDWRCIGATNTDILGVNKSNSITPKTKTITTSTTTTLDTNSNWRNLTLNDLGEGMLLDYGIAIDGKVPYAYNLTLINKDNTETATIGIGGSHTLGQIADKLSNYGIDLSVTSSGTISISQNPSSSNTWAITDMSSRVAERLGLTGKIGEGLSYTITTQDLPQTTSKVTHTITEDTTFAQLGLTGTRYMTVVQNGTSSRITIRTSDTVGDFIDKLADKGINSEIGTEANRLAGVFHILSSDTSYILSMDSEIRTALNLGNKETYTTTTKNIKQNTSTGKQLTKESTNTAISTTLLKDIGQSGNKTITASYNGNAYSLVLNETMRIEDALSQINSQFGYMGIYAVYSKTTGQVSIASSNSDKAYITDFGGAFGMTGNGYKTNVQTSGSITNTKSDHLQKEETRTANWDTTMEQLGYTNTDGYFRVVDKDGNSKSIGIDKTDTIRDVREKLAMYDIALNCSNGKITLSGTNGAYIWRGIGINNAFKIDLAFGAYKTQLTPISEKELNNITIEDLYLNGTMINTDLDGAFYINKDGVKTTISISYSDTIADLFNKLESTGLSCSITSDGRLKLTGNGNFTASTDGIDIHYVADLTLLGIDNSKWSHNTTYKSSSPVGVTNSSSVTEGAQRDTKLSDLGVTTGEYLLYKDGIKHTLYVSSDDTLGDFMNSLRSFGIESSLVTNNNNTTIRLHAEGDSYIATSKASDSSNIVDKLFGSTKNQTYTHSTQLGYNKTVTTTENATEDTRINDIIYKGGVLGTTDSIQVVFNDETMKINLTADETIGSFLDKFRALGLEATIADGKIMIQSGFNSLSIINSRNGSSYRLGLTANSDLGGYSASSKEVKSTEVIVEEKHNSVANYADYNTKLSLLNISDGTLTLYRNGEKATIQVDSNQTFGDLRSKISAKFSDVAMTFENGYLKISSNQGDVVVGTTTDSSNFAAITGMSSNTKGEAVSSRSLYCVNNNSTVTTSDLFVRGQVTEGNFKVGNATITIDSKTTINDIISQINYSDDSNATAYWDSIDGKFVIKSKTSGASLINIEAGTSNFTDIMGFTSVQDGKKVMNTESQELGKNAVFTINGTRFTSTSNTVTSDVSRIQGVTLNLKDITTDEAVTLTIEKDKETAANAISDIVDAYNELIANVDKEVARGANLSSESTLRLIRNQIRSLMTSSIANKGSFKNLASIGISLAAASSGNIRTDNINELSFDKDKFIESFGADLSSLKSLLVGTDEQKGILTQVEDVLEQALGGVTGYFASAEKSYSKKISKLDEKITKTNKAADRYKTRLEAKFKAMDMIISKFQNQYSSFLG